MKFLATQPNGPPTADIRYLASQSFADTMSFIGWIVLIIGGYVVGLEVLTRWLS